MRRRMLTFVVGLCACFLTWGVTDSNGDEFSTVFFPSSLDIGALGINDLCEIVGDYDDDSGQHGYLYNGINFYTIDYPEAFATCAWEITNSGLNVGHYDDGAIHGFIYDGKTYISIDYPSATETRIIGANNDVHIVGDYVDFNLTGRYGFFACDLDSVKGGRKVKR